MSMEGGSPDTSDSWLGTLAIAVGKGDTGARVGVAHYRFNGSVHEGAGRVGVVVERGDNGGCFTRPWILRRGENRG